LQAEDNDQRDTVKEKVDQQRNIAQQDFLRSVTFVVAIREVKVPEYSEYDERNCKTESRSPELSDGSGP